jgi:anti-sigma regulatory factor (Ser/Thr protein kinase)
MLEVVVADASQVADARRRAGARAEVAGFDSTRAAQVALVATELATNLIKHGGGGRLLIDDADTHIDLLALDRGPGMADVDACLADGFSTAGTPGNGLGAVRRLSQALHVASWPNLGTAVLARMTRDKSEPVPPAAVGAVVLAKPGEQVCGDAWSAHEDGAGRTLFVVDGLGHGTEAAVAANAAVAQFQRSREEAPADIVQSVHLAMRHTRGGAVAVARIVWESASVYFAGLGNIAGVLITPAGQMRRMVSHNGTAGHIARRIRAFEYPCAEGRLIMHSDGLATSWRLDAYPGLARAHPLLLAGVLYRDHARNRDDTTVVVATTGRP